MKKELFQIHKGQKAGDILILILLSLGMPCVFLSYTLLIGSCAWMLATNDSEFIRTGANAEYVLIPSMVVSIFLYILYLKLRASPWWKVEITESTIVFTKPLLKKRIPVSSVRTVIVGSLLGLSTGITTVLLRVYSKTRTDIRLSKEEAELCLKKIVAVSSQSVGILCDDAELIIGEDLPIGVANDRAGRWWIKAGIFGLCIGSTYLYALTSVSDKS